MQTLGSDGTVGTRCGMSILLTGLVNGTFRVQDAGLVDASHTVRSGVLGGLARSRVMSFTTMSAKQLIFALHANVTRFLTAVAFYPTLIACSDPQTVPLEVN